MLGDFAWKAFELTGSLESYVFYKELSNNATQREEVEETNGAINPAVIAVAN